MKMVVLACLRIAAVTYDIELKQEMYTKVYYESAVRDQRGIQSIQKYFFASSNHGKLALF